MERRLANHKKREYDELCDVIRKLTQEIDFLQEKHIDATKTNEDLEIALNRYISFIQREFKDKK